MWTPSYGLKNNNNNNLRSKRYAFFVASYPVSHHATPCFYFILFSLVASLKHKKDNDDDKCLYKLKSKNTSLLSFCSFFFVLFERSIGEWVCESRLFIYIKDLTTNTHISQLVLLARVTTDLVLVIIKWCFEPYLSSGSRIGLCYSH